MMLLIQYTLVFSSVLLLVALGGCFSERSGIINIGLEGIMVIGALGGVMVLHNLSPQLPGIVILLLTVAASIAAGMIYSLLLAVASINFKADQTLVGTAMNMLGLALATVIAKAYNIATTSGADNSARIAFVENKKALALVEGTEFNWFMILAFAALAVGWVVLYKTRFGLRLMACGEHPQAADSVGINVKKMRYSGVLISGAVGGLGGIAYVTAGVSMCNFEVGVAGFRLPRACGNDFRSVETFAHCNCGTAVWVLPRTCKRIQRIRLPDCAQYSEARLQHASVHNFPHRACVHF